LLFTLAIFFVAMYSSTLCRLFVSTTRVRSW
jgi:hypothetical protein